MALIKLTASELEGVKSQISKMSGKASDCANRAASVRNNLDMEISAKRNIEERLDNIKRDLIKHSESLKSYANVLDDVINEFVKVDTSSFESIQTSVVLPITTANQRILNANSSLIDLKLERINATENLFGLTAIGITGGLNAFEQTQSGIKKIQQTDMLSNFSADFSNILLCNSIVKDSATEYIDQKMDEAVDNKRNTDKNIVDETTYYSSDQGDILGMRYTHNTDVRTVRYETEYYDENGVYCDARNIEGELSMITEQYIVGDDEANFKLNLNEMSSHADAKFDLSKGDAYVSAGAQYNVASAEAAFDTDMASGSVGVEVGVGGSVDVGVRDRTIHIGASAAVGVGVHFDVSVNYGILVDSAKDMWSDFCDGISGLFSW